VCVSVCERLCLCLCLCVFVRARLCVLDIELMAPAVACALTCDTGMRLSDMRTDMRHGTDMRARHAGLLLISHDFRLLDQVAQEVWVCDKGITKWESGMREYKDSLKKAMALIAEG
jgi:hypothetical protein